MAGTKGLLHAPVAMTTARARHGPSSVSTTCRSPLDRIPVTLVRDRTGASKELW